MLEEKSTPSRSPTWWKDDHETAWTRVKGAFHHDWQQTRSDVSGGRTGLDLNQSAGDTVAQALGNKRIPPDTITNPMTDAQRTAHVARAAKQMERSALELGEDEATAIDQKPPPRSNALGQWDKWDDAEAPLRYGYAASSYYPATEWDDDTEGRLRGEWDGMNPDLGWDEVRETVRHGWDHGRT